MGISFDAGYGKSHIPSLFDLKQRNKREAFERFHAENPHVYERIEQLALWLVREKKLRRIGMRLIFERLRWEHAIKTRGDAFKLNNNHTGFYARMLLVRQPWLADYIETRGGVHVGE